MIEKLIELIKPVLECLPWGEITSHTAKDIAKRLVENGATFVEDINALSKWIPVDERLPEHFGVFIVAIREPCKERVGKDCADFDPFAKTWLPSMCWDKGYKITHWMPLPEPPKGE